MSRRFWSNREREILRAEYGRTPAVTLARRLRRTLRAIHHEAKKLNLTRARCITDDSFREFVREKNADGYPDQEIAAELGCERHTVSRHRKLMGLPSQARSHRYILRVKQATRKQCEAVGVDSVGAVRSLMFKLRSIESGWGENLRPRHVEILDLLSERGPQTRRQICEAIGMKWLGSRASLKSSDAEGSYLAHLITRGLVVSMGRIVKGQGKGYSTNLYTISLTAERDDEFGKAIFGDSIEGIGHRLAGADAASGL